ncbi:UNVERIFIED_CONTAM: hypothetical protein Sindi_1858100 [Sesamum indicum]
MTVWMGKMRWRLIGPPWSFSLLTVLANGVIDKGNDESVRALNDLHRHWTAKYGEGDRNSQELLFYRLVRLTAEQVVEHPPCLEQSLQIFENRAAVDLNLRVSMVPLVARDEATMVAQPITPSPDRIQNIGEPEMMMMEVLFVENASRLGVVCLLKTAWMPSPILAANTAATAQMASATGQAETVKTTAAAASAVKTAVVTSRPPMMLPELPTADPVSVDAAPVHVTADATLQLPISSPTGIFVGNVPLQPCLNFVNYYDKIANIFHNSSKKILTYVPPMMQNGEIIVRPTLGMVRDGSHR